MLDTDLHKTDEIAAFRESFSGIAKKELAAVIDEQFGELGRIVKAFKTRHQKLQDAVEQDPDGMKNLRDFNSSLLEMLGKYQQNVKDNQQKAYFDKYEIALNEESGKFSSILTRRELFVPYQLNFGGNIGRFWRKIFLNTGYYLRRNLILFLNIFRKLFRLREKDSKIYRTRKVPFRNMAAYHLGSGIIPGMSDVSGRFLKLKSSVLYRLWKFNEKIDDSLQGHVSDDKQIEIADIFNQEEYDELTKGIDGDILKLKPELHTAIEEAVELAFEKFELAEAKVDTPDLSVKTYLKKNLTASREDTKTTFTDTLTRWENNLVTLFDDWIVDVEVVQLYYSVLSDFNALKAKIDQFLSNHLTQNLDELTGFINDSSSRIEVAAVSVKQVKEALANERKVINRDFADKMLTRSVAKISGSYSDDIEKFRQNTIKLADKVSTKRGFVQGAKYDRGFRTGEIKYLSPRELLNFEAIPHFEKAVGVVREQVEASLEKAKLKLISSGTVCDFSLESALLLLDQKKKSYREAQKVATEGYQRAIKNIGEARELMTKINEQPLASLQTAIHDFNAEIQKLKNTENLLELNIRIVRIRAVERSKKARREAAEMVKNLIPTAVSFFKEKGVQASAVMDGLKNKIGIASHKKQISYEVTEFINQAEASLKKLPFIYQRLYQIQATDEERFFVNRTEEIEMLEIAFNDWTKERFVTTAIVGEKGNGVTSLINYFINRLQTEMAVIHHTIDQKIYKPNQYFHFFAEILDQEKFESNEEIIAFLNNKHEKSIIILENLQHAFLKKVNGLDCQQLFFDLMANTAQNVFWLGSYTIFSWEYLDRVIQISDNFVRDIRLKPMDSKSLMEIIYKRNSLSGYKLRFQPTEEEAEARWYKKADAKERNRILRNKFFNDLSVWSNGNVSLSQLYWLHSTREVTDDTISIGASFNIDLSFIQTIKAEYLFVLHTILIHDGLTLEDYSEVFNQSESQSRNRLVPMLEKGLLIRPREKFNVNPIVFRQVVNLLRSRNFIS